MVSEELTRMRTGFVYSLRLNLGFSYTGVENIAALRIQEIGSFGKMQIHVRVEKKKKKIHKFERNTFVDSNFYHLAYI